MARLRWYSFVCLQRFLLGFNSLLLLFGLLLATLPVYFTIHKVLKSWPINGGIIGMGIILVLLALCGFQGSIKQHQIILFFYIIILAVICLIMFAFSLAALSVNKTQKHTVLTHGWNQLSNITKGDIQRLGNCCGFYEADYNKTSLDYASCTDLKCFQDSSGCSSCLALIENSWFIIFCRSIGGVALFVSLLMCITIYLSWLYRNLKNPSKNLSNFL